MDTHLDRLCLSPNKNIEPINFVLPPLSCDCHSHVIGPEKKFPFVENRSYTPPPASLEDYVALHKALGIERAVIVQPSVHGTDNRVTLDAIARYGKNARGVAVVEPTITNSEIENLHKGGIRGVRLNLLFKGGVGLETMELLSEKISPYGWHVQLLIDVQTLTELSPRIRALPTPVVIDHIGHMATEHGIMHPGFQELVRLTAEGVCWVKLSGNYRISSAGFPFADAIPFAKALVAANPDQLVWGTDWPHPALYEYMPNDGGLLNALEDYAPEASVRKKILVDNPAKLYDF